MKLLLDTHIFLWFISGDDRLPQVVRDGIRNPDNDVYLHGRHVLCLRANPPMSS